MKLAYAIVTTTHHTVACLTHLPFCHREKLMEVVLKLVLIESEGC